MPDCDSLKVPNGLVWKVGLIHSNHEAWLHRGWQRFEEYYSIQLGNFLLLKYVGKEHFEVHMFDTTATGIEYSYYDSLERDAGENQLIAITEGVESDCDDSIVFLKENLAGKSVGRKHQDVDDIDMSNNQTNTSNMEKEATRSPGNVDRLSPLYFEKVLKTYHRSRVVSYDSFGFVGLA